MEDDEHETSISTVKYEKACRVEEGCTCMVRVTVMKCCCVGSTVNEIPQNLSESVKTLLLYGIAVERINDGDFDRYPSLEEVVIEDSETLNFIDGNAFGKLRNLGKLSVSGCKNLKEITGTLLINNTKILSLIIEENGLVRMPTLRMTDQHRFAMELIDFSHNEIEYLGDGQIRSVHANELRLSHNKFREIGGHVFADCKFSYIYLDNNMELKRMSMNTFGGISLIQNLDLSRTAISELPTKGLSKLERLKLEDTDNLKKLPTILAFTSLKKAEFTYPYHCCLFRHASKEIDLAGKEFTENLEEIRSRECSAKAEALSRIKMALRRRKRSVDANDSKEGPLDLSDLFMWFDSVNNGDVLIEVGDDSPELDPEFDDEQIGQLTNFNCTSSAVSDFFASIECSPMPDALNPCENVVGYQFLRWAIWFVWISAIIGNIGVWVVLATVRQKRMRVHYFFMANLAAADLLTGVHLCMLAIQDVRTSDEYYNYAVNWQTGVGCQIAGFLSVFASELSILSMFFIAFEMLYNTKNAFYGRRLHERTAYILMGCAYIFALTMALLPLVGVSTYTSTSVCLPLSIENVFDRFYLMFGLLFNLLAFLGMSVCYVLIVKMLRNPDQPSRPEDKQIIAKMAVLIGTDMLCWFPTLFFGFTATLNMPLISISVAKIFLVLFYPINAFANPFLYVFFTKVIQKNVRPRAMSFLKRISLTNLTNDRTITSLSNFYNTQPTYRFKLDEIRHLLQTTQVTSVASTPRGSNASSYQKTITSCNETSWKSSPRVSFQEETVNHLAIPPKRKSISGQKQRVSAVPEMSDISEHSISDEHHDKLIKASSNSAKPLAISRFLRVPAPYGCSTRSLGNDSGRGDSIASNWSLREQRTCQSEQLSNDGHLVCRRLPMLVVSKSESGTAAVGDNDTLIEHRCNDLSRNVHIISA
ncbi:Follicle-stimulating hormone receptor [Toxocara canis]|uniref:Follicle-stimulating hormone receptor n=1 Tax=Toxocara canis TaxID=6265 RepID=A0A0B2VFC6_TOXCA|nr:Follicle-stimulating hormone receptor [Toxocara canis]